MLSCFWSLFWSHLNFSLNREKTICISCFSWAYRNSLNVSEHFYETNNKRRVCVPFLEDFRYVTRYLLALLWRAANNGDIPGTGRTAQRVACYFPTFCFISLINALFISFIHTYLKCTHRNKTWLRSRFISRKTHVNQIFSARKTRK